MPSEVPSGDTDRLNPDQIGVRKLLDQLHSHQGIVPFVGAGMSVPFGMPSWKQFLLDLARDADNEDDLRVMLDEGRFEETAERLHEDLAPLAFNDAVEDAFGDHALVEPPGPVSAAYLPLLATGPVITTNLDHVLERVFEQAGQPFHLAVWGAKAKSITDALQLDRRVLIKVHGDVGDTADRVLTRSEYDDHYGDLLDGGEPSKPLSRLLQRLLESRTVLFVGCSLKDDRIVDILNAAAARTGAYSHYAIVPEPVTVDAGRQRARFLSKRRIRPIWYPAGRHDLIGPFLEDLARQLGASSDVPLTPLVSAEEFFRPLLRPAPGRLLHHDWSLVGRKAILDHIDDWVRNESCPVGMLSGRGGIGKTKLLHAFSEGFRDRHPEVTLRFALAGIPLAIENLMGSPAGLTVVVVDDAHHRDDLGVLLGFVQQHRGHVKLLLATRPHRIDTLRSSLTKARFDIREIASLGQLDDLTRSETHELACQALGPLCNDYAARLADVTRDSPLVTVLGGQLLAERAVSPQLLERDAEFRQVLLDRFQDVLTGQVSDLIDPSLVRELLRLVAALAPIRPGNEQFLQAAAQFLRTTAGEVVEGIDALEAAGVLLRRGGTLRITPDVLGDHILHQACFVRTGVPTGYAQDVFDAFRSLYPAQVLGSLAELDWRVSLATGENTLLLDGIWQTLEEEFRRGSHREQALLLALVQEVAYHQPDRALRLVEYAIRNPASTQVDDRDPPWRADTRDTVLEVLPGVLRRIGYNADYLPRVCDLLWELGQNDARPVNPYPDHAMRVLVDFAAYDADKPLRINATVLEAAGRWLQQPDAHTHLHSLLDILDPLLAKTGTTDRSEGYHWVVSPFMVSREATAPLRREALNLILACLDLGEPKVTLRVLDSLLEVLQAPRPRFNQNLTREEIDTWLPERLEALRAIGRIVEATSSPVVHLRIAEGLAWYIDAGRQDEIGVASREVVDTIPRTLDLRLLAALGHKGEVWQVQDVPLTAEGYEERQHRHDDAIRSCAAAFVAAYPDPVAGAQVIEDGLRALLTHGTTPVPMAFFMDLSAESVEYAAGAAEYGLQNPEGLLAHYLGYFLGDLRATDPARAISFADRALSSGSTTLARSVSSWPRLSVKDVQEGDLRIIRRLLSQPDRHVRYGAIESLATLGRAQRHTATKLALSVEVGTDAELASAICRVFDADFGVDPALLEDDDVSGLLEMLGGVNAINDYHVGRFLAHAYKRMPRRVTSMLLDRIDDGARTTRVEFEPLPFEGLEAVLAGASSHPEFEQVLRDVRERALGDSWQTRFWLPRLFRAVSAGFSPASLSLVEVWAVSGDPAKTRAAARLLAGAPPGLLFDHQELIVKLLESSHALGGDVYEEVADLLGTSARTEPRSRTLGVDEVYPEDALLEQRAAKALIGLATGSPAHRFYADLRAFAEASMRWERIRDEEEFS